MKCRCMARSVVRFGIGYQPLPEQICVGQARFGVALGRWLCGGLSHEFGVKDTRVRLASPDVATGWDFVFGFVGDRHAVEISDGVVASGAPCWIPAWSVLCRIVWAVGVFPGTRLVAVQMGRANLRLCLYSVRSVFPGSSVARV